MRQPASHPAYIFLTGGLFFAFKRRWSPMSEGRLMRDRQLRYFFEEYAFDTDRRELHRGADLVSITPQVFDLLAYLIRHRERVVSKDDLMSAVRNFPHAHFYFAAALGLLGALDEARTAAKAGLAINPSLTIHRLRAAKISDNPIFLAGRERIYMGLRLAGVPEQ